MVSLQHTYNNVGHATACLTNDFGKSAESFDFVIRSHRASIIKINTLATFDQYAQWHNATSDSDPTAERYNKLSVSELQSIKDWWDTNCRNKFYGITK